MHDQISPEGHWLNKTGHVDFDSFLGGEGCHPQVYSPRGDEKQKVCIYLSAGKSRGVAIWQKEIYC